MASFDMEGIKRQYFDCESKIGQVLEGKEPIRKVSEVTKQPSGRLAIITFSLLSLIMWFTCQPLVTGLVGFIYPAFCSIKAIESASTEDDRQWLTYWVIFAYISVIEYFSDTLTYWIPFYYYIKLAALCYLILPNTRGAEAVYNKLIKPYASNLSIFQTKNEGENAPEAESEKQD